MSYNLSLSGHPLIGVKMTRFVYLDETGTHVEKDPITIVGGIIVHADRQMTDLESSFGRMVCEKVPRHLWENEDKPFSLHAVDYINGNGAFKILKKEGKWSVDKGMEIAESIVSLCERLSIKIVWGGAENKEGLSKENRHVHAFALAALNIDHYMLSEAHGEVCIIVAENHQHHKKKLKKVVSGLKSEGALRSAGLEGSIVPIKTIKDVVHFVEKTDSYCIQIADTVCYILKKYGDKNPHYTELAKRLLAIGAISTS